MLVNLTESEKADHSYIPLQKNFQILHPNMVNDRLWASECQHNDIQWKFGIRILLNPLERQNDGLWVICRLTQACNFPRSFPVVDVTSLTDFIFRPSGVGGYGLECFTVQCTLYTVHWVKLCNSYREVFYLSFITKYTLMSTESVLPAPLPNLPDHWADKLVL